MPESNTDYPNVADFMECFCGYLWFVLNRDHQVPKQDMSSTANRFSGLKGLLTIWQATCVMTG